MISCVVCFPRSILAEVNTHGILSKNTSSSRAIPYMRSGVRLAGGAPSMREMVMDSPYLPVYYGRNISGMQATQELDLGSRERCKELILAGRDRAVEMCDSLYAIGLHKQDLNRYLEPWGWTYQIITGTHWNNFFALRTHVDAHPAFRFLARMMYLTFLKSVPTKLGVGEWHLPFIREEEKGKWGLSDLRRISVARCARVSYTNHEGLASSYSKDIELFERLTSAFPGHWSPTMHQACPLMQGDRRVSNLIGWTSFRKTFANENILSFTPSEADLLQWSVETGVSL